MALACVTARPHPHRQTNEQHDCTYGSETSVQHYQRERYRWRSHKCRRKRSVSEELQVEERNRETDTTNNSIINIIFIYNITNPLSIKLYLIYAQHLFMSFHKIRMVRYRCTPPAPLCDDLTLAERLIMTTTSPR